MNKNSPKILFILTARFPTEKAYGVTTEFSARATKELGYFTSIITPKRDHDLLSMLYVDEVMGRLYAILLSSKIKLFTSLRYHFFLCVYAFAIKNKMKYLNNIFWTRDVFIAFVLSVISRNRIVLELHNIPTGFRVFLVNFLIKKPLVFVSPISNFLESQFNFDKNRYMIAPMAVNSTEIVDFPDNKTRNKTIIYVGQPESKGKKLNFTLMNELAELIWQEYPDWIFEVVGFDKNFFEKQMAKSCSKNFNFLGPVPREIALSRMNLARIGLVLYENDSYHQFPLKIVEYAASGLTILASDTSIHRRILGSKKCVFFDGTSSKSAFLSFRNLQNNYKETYEIKANLNNWVKGLTYQKRVYRVLDNVLKDF